MWKVAGRLALGVMGVLLAAGAHAQATTAAASAPPPVQDFFKRPMLASPVLSPDGRKLAMLVPGPSGRTVLAVADVETPTRRVGVARFDDADVGSVQWVNDKRLVFTAIDFQSALGDQFSGGLYAVDVDGENFVWLIGRGIAAESKGHPANRPLRANHVFARTLRDGSDDVLVVRYRFREFVDDPGGSTVLRLNTRSKATRELVQDEPDHAFEWVLDGKAQPRSAISVDAKGIARVLLRDRNEGAWRELARYDSYDPPPGSIVPAGFDKDGNLLVRSLRDDPARTTALFRLDLKTGQRDDKPLVAIKDHDLTGDLIFDRVSGELIGVNYVSDAQGIAWLHPEMQKLQQRVDELLPGTANLLRCGGDCLRQQRFVVASWSDRQPGVYFLFDKTRSGRDSLTLIGASRPWIDPRRMAQQDLVQVKARDGTIVPTYVTKPAGKGPWPTVVMVHGGPYVRGVTWGWNPDAQFLASRGYMVVEPEFRGSTGYGDKHFRAGWKQWGLTMQDDVTDVTNWAVAQGLADAKRLVIAGGSYGGYATMMGLVKEPELYRAGINIVGVTDIDLMYSVDWSDFAGSVWQRYGMSRLVGDREKDRAQLDRTSPLKRAAEITKPVLMAYGGKDFRVPLPHGTKMRDALKAAGKVEVEWVEYEDEGHGFLLEKNQIDFWTRVENFLARHVK